MTGLNAERSIYANKNTSFIDLGGGTVAEDRLKLAFVDLLANQIKDLGLTQAEAAELMGIRQPDVSRLLRRRADRFALARVLAFVRALGGDVEINVRAKSSIGQGLMKFHMARDAA